MGLAHQPASPVQTSRALLPLGEVYVPYPPGFRDPQWELLFVSGADVSGGPYLPGPWV